MARFLFEMFSEAFDCNEDLERRGGVPQTNEWHGFFLKCFESLLIVMKRWRGEGVCPKQMNGTVFA
jgi:hypothetical protein